MRQVYPPDLFIRRKKYDTPVFQSRHPALNEYISGAVKALEDELLLGVVDKFVVVIKNKEQVALERFIFSVQQMIQVEPYDKESKFVVLPSLMTRRLLSCLSGLKSRERYLAKVAGAVLPLVSHQA